MLSGKLLQEPGIQQPDVFTYGCLLCLENPYAFLIQFVQSACTNTPHYHSINLLTVHRHNRVASTMFMVLITVADR
jgi:hypothetical protein